MATGHADISFSATRHVSGPPCRALYLYQATTCSWQRLTTLMTLVRRQESAN